MKKIEITLTGMEMEKIEDTAMKIHRLDLFQNNFEGLLHLLLGFATKAIRDIENARMKALL